MLESTSDSECVRAVLVDMLHDVLRVNLVQSAFAGTAYGTDLSTTHAELLEELAQQPDLNIPQLAEISCLNKSSVSRALNELASEGYLTQNMQATSSARRKAYVLSKKGKAFIAHAIRFNQRWMASCLKRLSHQEASTFLALLQRFANHSGAKPLRTVASNLAQSIFDQFTRLTRAHKVSSDNYMGSGHSVVDLLILSDINYLEKQAHQLARAYSMTPNSIGQVLRRYRERGLYLDTPAAEDSRAKTLRLSATGSEKLRHIEGCVRLQLLAELKDFSIPELLSLTRLLQTFVGKRVEFRRVLMQEPLWISRVLDEPLRSSLRWSLVRVLSDRGSAYYPLSSKLFAPDSICCAIYIAQSPLGAIELEVAERECVVLNYFWSGDAALAPSPQTLAGVVQRLLPTLPALNQASLARFFAAA